MTSTSKSLKSYLHERGHSYTPTRELIFQVINRTGTLSRHDLLMQTEGSCDRASVYRTLNLFEVLGVTKRIQIGWKYSIELSDIFQAHHHHIRCVTCQATEDIQETAVLADEIKKLADRHGYNILSHELELQGICGSCSHNTQKT